MSNPVLRRQKIIGQAKHSEKLKLTGDFLKKFDDAASLPKKDGKHNDENYLKWNTTSLRGRLWDRMIAKQCVRCGSGDHLRSSCTVARAPWEDDFDTGSSFWTPKQSRSQLFLDGK